MNVLVTGANGHLGSHIVRSYLARGHRVYAMVRTGSDRRSLKGLDVKLRIGDIRNEKAVRAAAHHCELIIHCAAVYEWSGVSDAEIIEPAMIGARNVITAAKEHGIGRIVFTSSTIAVGTSMTPTELRTERDWNDTGAFVPYARAKMESEREIVRLGAQNRIEVVVLNPTAIIGPGDYKITPSTRLLRDFLVGQQPTTEGSINFVDVRDVAQAHLAAAERGRPGERYILAAEALPNRVFGELVENLVGKRPPHVPLPRNVMLGGVWLVEKLVRALGGKPPVSYNLASVGVGTHHVYDCTKAKTELGWSPRPLRESVAEGSRWLAEIGNLPTPLAKHVLELAS